MSFRCRSITVLVPVGVAAVMLAATVAAQTGDPSGTYTLNVAKSKFTPGPAPKSGTVTYTAAGKGVTVAVATVAADGTKVQWEYTADYDGKDYPIKGNNPDADSAALKRINATTVEIANKKAGKPTTVNTRVLSADGKTLTVTTTGTNAQGQTVNNVQVFEK